MFHNALSFVRTPIDGHLRQIREKLLAAKIDYACIMYDVRLAHTQLVGTTEPADSTHHPSYGRGIHRKLAYKCFIVNVTENKNIYFKEINRKKPARTLI